MSLRGARPFASFCMVFPTFVAYVALLGKVHNDDEDAHQGGVYGAWAARNLSLPSAKSARSASAESSAPTCEPSGLCELWRHRRRVGPAPRRDARCRA